MDFPGIARHLIALKCNSIGGVYEQQAVYRRFQNRSGKASNITRLFCRRSGQSIRGKVSQLYYWQKRYGQIGSVRVNAKDDQAEIARLKAELRRVTEDRDILKKAVEYSVNQRN